MKRIKILLIALILVLGGVFFSNTYAATRDLGVKLNRPFTNSKYQYTVQNNLKYTVVKIYDNADKVNNELAYTKALYCLRGGKGFGADDRTDISSTPITYTELGEMHENAKQVIDKYNELYGINLDRTETLNNKEVNIYNAALWILDESYLPTDRKNSQNQTIYNEAEYKKELLDKAGIPNSEQSAITKDDIEVIQQLAVWYFVNYDEQKAGTTPTVSQATKFPAQFLSINGNDNIDSTREENLNRLYQYLIYGAIDNSSSYVINSTTKARTKVVETNKFDKTNPISVSSIKGSGLYTYYEIGPVKFERNGSANVDASDTVLYDAEGNAIPKFYEPEAGVKNTIYRFVDNEGNEATQLVKGATYYIRFYQAFEKGSTIIPNITEEDQYNISKVTIKVQSSYSLSTAKFLYRNNTDQAVVEINKEKIGDEDEITTQVYDLALRKFIVSINGQVLTGEDSRVPKIDLSKLNTIDSRTGKQITTATYTHPKNALTIQTGDKIVYTIRIYNEGEIDGKALEVTDYLPEGLELASNSTINTQYGWTTTDGKTIKTEKLNNTVIKAYDPEKTSGDSSLWQKAQVGNSGLYYADVQVECNVVAQVGSSDKTLRNIAEITNDDGDDRDSTPDNVNTNSYNPPQDNSSYQEDDDDYEDLVLKAKDFDLALRKFISKVERNGEDLQISSRVPSIEITNLKNATQDTARYVHPKNKLSLKRGDIITYTIRVYNEGELDGYAKQVKDYLPSGLELVDGQNEIWQVNGNTLTTNALQNSIIKGYDKTKTQASEGWQKASDDETGLYYYDLNVVCRIKDSVTDGATLVNIAEITSDQSLPTDIDDRDSQPNNFPDGNKNNNYNGNGEENGYFPGKQDDDDVEPITVEPREVFDLSLRKYIVSVNGNNLEGDLSRTPNIDVNPLNQGQTTADYKHRKDPVEVNVGDTVTYRFSVYNEGELDGYVYSIVDYLPAGLTFDSTLNESDEYNFNVDGNKLTITPKNSEKLFELNAFNGTTLDSKYLDVKFKVNAQESNDDQILTNAATMTYGAKGSSQTDRDSSGSEFTIPGAAELVNKNLPGYKGNSSNKDQLNDKTYHYAGQQDDDDFEKIIIKGKPFDLSLRKFITGIKRNGENVEFDDRTPSIDTTTLINGTFNRNGTNEYTATYEHSKEPIVVKKGDIITYTLRVYNEGARDGYASEITDYIPEGLALIKDYKTNYDNKWKLPSDLDNSKVISLIGENGFYKSEDDVKNFKLEDFENTASLTDVQLVTGKVAIRTTELDDELLKAFDKNKTESEDGWQKAETGEGGLYYKDVQVSCLVIAENTYKETITNVSEISEDKDKNGNPVIDRDSTPNNKIDPYTTWQEDDDDYEPVVLKYFDLALRKFITGVETNGKTTDINSRIPVVTLNEDSGNLLKYTHPKEEAPVAVANNDVVIYTLRIYNEGTMEGFAEEITDDIPEGLEYLPDHSINKQYQWKMVDKDDNITDKVSEAKTIKTEYLSEAKGESEGRNNKLQPFDSSKAISAEEPLNPDYRDVKIAFRVIEPNTSDRIIVNSAQISEDSGDDEDSVPGEWNEGEDDQDKEYIYVKYFDLSLLKWVTKTVVTVDGKTTTRETGFKPNTGKTETTGIRKNSENEPVAKVELDRKKLNKTTVKFVYKIRVTNEGEIAGYATEITDFIPSGLEFKAEDNKKFGWTKSGNDKVTTRALETKLLQPGQSAEVEIVFTWKKDKNNLGVKTNIAEITEDYNEYNSKDIDSTPKNKKNPYDKEQEDDDDFALVVLSLKTGKAASYIGLTTIVVAVLAGGVYLIKKYILRS